jgi:starch phosphorylase
LGVPYDTPIAGYGNESVNTLRLWQRARRPRSSTSSYFQRRRLPQAVADKNISESISKVLYPRRHGRGARAAAEAAVLLRRLLAADIIRRYLSTHEASIRFPRRSRSSSTTRTRRWPWPS